MCHSEKTDILSGASFYRHVDLLTINPNIVIGASMGGIDLPKSSGKSKNTLKFLLSHSKLQRTHIRFKKFPYLCTQKSKTNV
jgi:hypothetical protein